MRRFGSTIRSGMKGLIVMGLMTLPMTLSAAGLKSGELNMQRKGESGTSSQEDRDSGQKGYFDAFDPKSGWIWIDDTVYQTVSTVKTRGTSTKLGLLRDIKPGELIEFTTAFNPKQPNIPLVIEIRRR